MHSYISNRQHMQSPGEQRQTVSVNGKLAKEVRFRLIFTGTYSSRSCND